MPIFSPFEKRLKRHIIGRRRTFFAATLPGFESLCLKEIRSLNLKDVAAEIATGGVEFNGRIHDCYQANLNLRTANRILMRIDAFRASNFHRLEKKIADLSWELYLKHPCEPELHVTSRQSRIIHTQAIAQRFRTGIAERFKSLDSSTVVESVKTVRPKLFIRAIKDHFTVSLDSSGDHLYKRGIKTQSAEAPLRETTAAAILMLAGYSRNEPLIDPMCGSGTFSLEAAMQAGNIPAGWFREFAFTDWPAFRINHKRWEYTKAERAEAITDSKKPLIFASDVDDMVCRQLSKYISKHGMMQTIHVQHRDFFDISPSRMADRSGLVVINPPYGRRLGTQKESVLLIQRICQKLVKEYKTWKIALILPRSHLKEIPFPVKKYPIQHGGLKLAVAVGKIP